ncbi:NAD(P)-dependent oxidoreductase [Actibacterium sp. 188UL27-1]|uniref:NAD(P)-dependent oxidoreductase n=1 Tax=Actibacterium sp. 188UL27-1 TaxID=2786961 RepID=UPI002104E293|nr:NAD(P)-binding domain-containing protein [Actibacterium sp. 188UL27-1]
MGPIGLAGCGRMGAPMLRALRDAGFAVRGYDLQPPEGFGDLTDIMGTDPAVFGRDLSVLISVVRDADQTDDVLFGAGDLVRKAPALRHVVISSTLSPRYIRDLGNRLPDRIRLIDAPMSGAVAGAVERRLSFMLGGDPADLDLLQPLFDAMGQSFHWMGPLGSGAQAKVLNNLLAASHTAMTRLVLDWADQAGLNEVDLLRLIEASSGQNWLASGMDTIEFARDGWEADNSIAILTKDIDAALDAAPDNADTHLPASIRAAIRALQPRSKP